MTDLIIPITLSNFDGGGRKGSSSSLLGRSDPPAMYAASTSTPVVGSVRPAGAGGLGTNSPHATDILCGRGCSTHHGNAVFRSVVRRHQPQYHSSSKAQKVELARCIVRAVSMLDPSGRFLEKSKSDRLWYEIEPKKALEKTKQALRERYNMKEDDDEYGMEEGDVAVQALERTLKQAEADAQAGLLPPPVGGGGGSRRKRKAGGSQSSRTPPNADAAAGVRPHDAPYYEAHMPPLTGHGVRANASPPLSERPAFRPPRSVSRRPSLVDFFFNVPSKFTNLSEAVNGGGKPGQMAARSAAATADHRGHHDGRRQDDDQVDQRPTAGQDDHYSGSSGAAGEHGHGHGHVHFAQQDRPPHHQHAGGTARHPRRRQQPKRTSIIDMFRGSISHFVGVEDQLMSAVFSEKAANRANNSVSANAAAAAAAAAATGNSRSFGASDHGGGTGIGDDDVILADIGDPFSTDYDGAAAAASSSSFAHAKGATMPVLPSLRPHASAAGSFGKHLNRMNPTEIRRERSTEIRRGRRKSRSGSIFRTFLRLSTPLDEESTRKLFEDVEKPADEKVDEENRRRASEVAAKSANIEADPGPDAVTSNSKDEDAAVAVAYDEVAPPPTKKPRRQSTYSIFSMFQPDASLLSNASADDAAAVCAGAAASAAGGVVGEGGTPRRKSVFHFMQSLRGSITGTGTVTGVFDDATGEGGKGAVAVAAGAGATLSMAAAAAAVTAEDEGDDDFDDDDDTPAGRTLRRTAPGAGPTTHGRRRSSIQKIMRWGSDMLGGEEWDDFVPV